MSTTDLCRPKLDNNLTKNVPSDVNKSMYVEFPSSFTAKKCKQLVTEISWDDLIGSIQSFDNDKCCHAIGIISTTLYKPAGEANMYVQFGYYPQKH